MSTIYDAITFLLYDNSVISVNVEYIILIKILATVDIGCVFIWASFTHVGMIDKIYFACSY